jgi:hypothetical protein
VPKNCSGCGETKPVAHFHKSRRALDGRSPKCKSCDNSKRYEDLYGITGAEYDKLLRAQGGVCAICHRRPRSKALAVDHCHDSQDVRGLLCFSCNSGILMYAQNDAERLDRAAEYLRNPPATYLEWRD